MRGRPGKGERHENDSLAVVQNFLGKESVDHGESTGEAGQAGSTGKSTGKSVGKATSKAGGEEPLAQNHSFLRPAVNEI